MPMETYRGIATKEFVERRNAIVLEESLKAKNKNTKVPLWWRWDCEFPEHDQVSRNSDHKTLYNGFEYDTVHKTYGNCDFKYYSKKGAHISDYILGQIKKGVVNTIVLWNWEKPQHTRIQEGEEVGYTIIAYVDAKYVLENISQNRFTLSSLYDII